MKTKTHVMSVLLFAILVLHVSLCCGTSGEYRAWTVSQDGATKTIVAVFEKYIPAEGKVLLSRLDGRQIHVADNALSAADMVFMEQTHGVVISHPGRVVVPADRNVTSTPDKGPSGPTEAAPLQETTQPRNYSRYLVVMEGDTAVGSGFIAMHSNKPCLFTNTHVLSGQSRMRARLLSGQDVGLKALMVADAYDVSLFTQDTAPMGLDIIDDIEASVSIGDAVLVLGNSLGGGVATEITGKVTGLGPELVEVDARFVAGNSGSPIVHLKTGKVIAIATFSVLRSMDGFGRDSKFNNVERRFGYRLDNIATMRNMSWQAFVKESSVVNAISTRTTDIWNLAVDVARHGAISNWEAHLRRDSVLRNSVEAWQKILAKGHARTGQGASSHMQLLSEKRRLLTSVLSLLSSDLPFVNPNSFTQYHRNRYERELKDRAILTSYFQCLQDGLSNDPFFLTR